MQKHKDGILWRLFNVALDMHTSSDYSSTPVPFRVGLAKSTLKTMPAESGDPLLALHLVPQGGECQPEDFLSFPNHTGDKNSIAA